MLGANFPILAPYYTTVTWVLIIEAVLACVAAVVGVEIKEFFERKNIRTRLKQKSMKEALLELLEQERSLDLSYFPHKLLNPEVTIPVILEIDKEVHSDDWKALRSLILENYLLPAARRQAYSLRPVKQLRAVRTFVLMPKVQDEPYLLYLLKNKIPIIRYTAAHAAAQIGTDTAFDAILESMNLSTHYLREPFLNALWRGSPKIYHYIEQRLKIEPNPYTRCSCWEIVAEKMNSHLVELAPEDLQSPYKNLKLAVIKSLGHFRHPSAVQLLAPLLQDADWEVRAIAARALGHLPAQRWVKDLSLLCSDRVWWVRLNAALALKRLGPAGVEELEALTPEKDPFAYDTAQYVLAFDTPNAGRVKIPSQ